MAPVISGNAAFNAAACGVKLADYLNDMELNCTCNIEGFRKSGDIDGVQLRLCTPYVLPGMWLSKIRVPGKELSDNELWQVLEEELITDEDYDRILESTTAIKYKGIEIGQIAGHNYDIKNDRIIYTAKIKKSYASLVSNKAVFWVDSGFSVNFGSSGFNFSIPSLDNLMIGNKRKVLLQDIGRNFADSLQVKGISSHKIIVTSVLRTMADVERLRRHNRNATENSCHMYGTTFDIAYNRYLRVEENAPAYSKQSTVADVRLKQILSEVLRDLRAEGRCWVKYEVKQGCFHLTVR